MSDRQVLDDDFFIKHNIAVENFDLEIYEEFFDADEVLELVALLKENKISFRLEKPTKAVGDSIIVGNQLALPIAVLYASVLNFEKIDAVREVALLEQTEGKVPEDSYLHSFSDKELMKILAESNLWHFRDWVFAKKILMQRGVDIATPSLEKWKEENANNFRVQKNVSLAIKIALPILSIALTFGISIYAIVFTLPYSYFVWQGKSKDLSGEKYFTYNESSRNWGMMLFLVSMIALILGLRIYIKDDY